MNETDEKYIIAAIREISLTLKAIAEQLTAIQDILLLNVPTAPPGVRRARDKR